MNVRLYQPNSGLAVFLVPFCIVAVAVFAGMATAVVGGQAGQKAIYYAGVFGLLGAGGLIAITRDEPVRVAYFALFLGLPIANALVPPGRVGLKIFDVVMITAALLLTGKRMLATTNDNRLPLFPGRSMAIAWLLSLPCVFFSMLPGLSAQILLVNAGVYAFFLMTLRELQRESGFKRIVMLLAVVMLIMDVGLLIDHFLHINLSLRGTNLNQYAYLGGMQIRRAAGFFQDPQTAGAFLACTITFMLLLLIRGRFKGSHFRYFLAVAVLFSVAALFTTMSRGAILSCLFVSVMALFLFNRWSGPMKVISVGSLAVLVMLMSMMPLDALLQLAPRTIAERFRDLNESIDARLMIWFDTWDMFADNPLTGIGMGTFQSYLLETRPGVVNYYGIGLMSGTPYVPDQPENGYLKILYEGGIAGAAAALIVAGDTLRRAAQVIRHTDRESDARTEGIAALAGLASFGITFITLFTWADCRIAALFAVFIAILWWRSIELTLSAGPER